ALVDYSARLALAAFDAAGVGDADADGDADEVFDALRELAGQGAARISVGPRHRLDHHFHRIEALLAAEHDLVVRRQAGDVEDLLFDLGWEHVDAAHNQHVVGATGHLFHAPHAARGAREQSGQ